MEDHTIQHCHNDADAAEEAAAEHRIGWARSVMLVKMHVAQRALTSRELRDLRERLLR